MIVYVRMRIRILAGNSSIEGILSVSVERVRGRVQVWDVRSGT